MEFSEDEDLYGTLGVLPEATDTEIRKAYKRLAVELHPDRYIDRPAEQEDAQRRFSKISYAYNVLKDAEQRNEYDFMRRLRTGGPELDEAPPPPSGEDRSQKKAMAERFFKQGLAHSMEKNYKAAVDAFKEAIRCHPDSAQYHAVLAATYQKMGWPAYAKAEIDAALRLDPKDHVALKLKNSMREAAAAEAERTKKKGRGKKKKGKTSELAVAQSKFKKKRTPFLQGLLGSLFGRK